MNEIDANQIVPLNTFEIKMKFPLSAPTKTVVHYSNSFDTIRKDVRLTVRADRLESSRAKFNDFRLPKSVCAINYRIVIKT